MSAYVRENSIVRKIWGSADSILLIFAGASAEFALNKAVDWLYFTGKLPKDPIGRLFSTVAYARSIVFSDTGKAIASIDRITSIHQNVESERGSQIPDWAYRDVLFMLIDYSIRSQELLAGKLTDAEKIEIFEVFHRMGMRMNVEGLPETFTDWQTMRTAQLQTNLQHTRFTEDLFQQYRTHLGWFRYQLLIETQTILTPPPVAELMNFKGTSFLRFTLPGYRLLRKLNATTLLRDALIPMQWKAEVRKLDILPHMK